MEDGWNYEDSVFLLDRIIFKCYKCIKIINTLIAFFIVRCYKWKIWKFVMNMNVKIKNCE